MGSRLFLFCLMLSWVLDFQVIGICLSRPIQWGSSMNATSTKSTRQNPWLVLFILLVVFGAIWLIAEWGSSSIRPGHSKGFRMGSKQSILRLKIDGVIVDGKKFLEPLLEYKDDDQIKAIVIEINSPGGVVGPSQEIFEEIRRVRTDLKKPVVAVSTGLMASGAYYAAAAADRIMVQPGTLVGSIGVIMEFTNLEKLYDWAKVGRFSITTGKYKDSGAEYRPMREDERQVFQGLVDDVLTQFVEAVAEGRQMEPEKVREVADGRVFTGRQAKELGLVDVMGTRDDAYGLAAELAGIPQDKWEIFDPPIQRPHWWDLLSGGGDDKEVHFDQILNKGLDRVLKLNLMNQPLFLMPGVI